MWDLHTDSWKKNACFYGGDCKQSQLKQTGHYYIIEVTQSARCNQTPPLSFKQIQNRVKCKCH